MIALRLVGGPHDGAEGGVSVWSEAPERIWLVPDPLKRARHGLLLTRKPCHHPMYRLTDNGEAVHVYSYGELGSDKPADLALSAA